MIVMISGRAGEGKTTFANFCKNEIQFPARVFSFAQAVKDTAKSMNWDGNKDDKGRKLLQAVGTGGRDYDEGTWANIAIKRIQDWIATFQIDKEEWFAFIDDWRFENEGNTIIEAFYPVLKVRIIRPQEFHLLLNTPLYNDVSEIGLPEYDWLNNTYYDFGIDNSSDLEDLKRTAQAFVELNLLRRK